MCSRFYYLLLQPIQLQITMGACYSKNEMKTYKTHPAKDLQSKCNASENKASQQQIFCLKLIYQDLIKRNPNRSMDSRTLEYFFHMNPILSTSLARRFVIESSSNKQQITEEMFVNSAIKYVKGRLQQKLKFLFCLYDLDESQGLSFNQLLAILLNSPQQELKQILTNDDFLRTLSTQQISYYILTSTMMNNQSAEQNNRLSLFPYLPLRKKSTQIVEQDPAFQSFTSTQPKKCAQVSSHYSSRELIEDLKKKIDKSLHTTQLIRRYSEYLFKANNLDLQNDQMSFDIFKFLVKSHPKIYQHCFQGFHQYLWLHVDGAPLYKRLKCKMASFCVQKCGNNSKNIYLIHLKNSLIVFDDQNMTKPQSIKNLQGLQIEQFESQDQFGFVLRHRDGFYPECKYYFDKQTQKQWLNSLKQFLEQSVFKVYKLEQKIGKGSFCNVFKCENIKTGQKKAIKIIDKTKISPVQIAAINSQSQILATCAMPNVVRAYQRFETKQNIYLITQLIQGGTLYEYVKRNNRKYLQQKQSRQIMKELLKAVANLHQIGIIHRDLKLENILMKNQGGHAVPKIIDFGLAIYQLDMANIDDKRKFVGTPNFVGPEIYMHEEYTENVDIFSLGVIMHFLLTGVLPFNASKLETVRELTMQCYINFETKRWSNISQNAKDLISKMISWKEDRISAEDALEHEWFHSDY